MTSLYISYSCVTLVNRDLHLHLTDILIFDRKECRGGNRYYLVNKFPKSNLRLLMATHGLNQYYSRYRSPFGDLLALFASAQATYKCRELELNVLDCTDVYGHKGLMKECLVPFQDFHECIYENKQDLRVEAMRKERARQYLSGERSKENLYAETPKLDGYHKTYGRCID